MGYLRVRTDDEMEAALAALAQRHGARSAAVRHALLRSYREMLVDKDGRMPSGWLRIPMIRPRRWQFNGSWA